MDTRIEAQTDIARDRRWPLADGKVFVNVTGPLGANGPVIVHLQAAIGFDTQYPEADTPGVDLDRWGHHLVELLGGSVSVVLSVPLPKTDRATTAFIDIDGGTTCISLGATTRRARAELRRVIIEALDALVTPADERTPS